VVAEPGYQFCTLEYLICALSSATSSISGIKTTDGNVHDSSRRYFDGILAHERDFWRMTNRGRDASRDSLLADGTLDPEAFRRYVAQDVFFLNAFARAYALAAASSQDGETLISLCELLNGVLRELQLHAGYAKELKIELARVSVLHGKGPGDRECIPIVVRFGSDAA
jgi:hypothetical protein